MRQILVVDADPSLRRLARLSLEIDGAFVLEAGSLAQARHQAFAKGFNADGFDGIVIDRELPDGDGLDLVAEMRAHWPAARMVVLTDDSPVTVPTSLASVHKGDMQSLVAALAIPVDLKAPRTLAIVELLRNEHEALAADWRELCRWDPMLPPDNQPPIASAFIAAVVSAMSRPQPLGWGADPEVEKVADVFAAAVGTLDVAIGQLVCLREALRRRIAGRLPVHELVETTDRLQMIIDRAIGVAAARMTERLQQQAYVDALTGLLNRRALERDLRREVGRAARHHRRFSLMVIDLDGLKRVNDTEGHAAGDAYLKSMAQAMRSATRIGDTAYRIGGDEFVVLLPETDEGRAERVAQRVLQEGGPQFSWGSVTYPDDGDDLDELIDLADKRLFDQRRAVRGSTTTRPS
jgi:diguanylate cyclase (GGDEF)-like protein